MQGEIANQPTTEKTVERTLSTIGRYDQWCRERGIRFIFLPIPNKENIYYDLLPGKMKPAFLRVLINRLYGAEIDTIDTQSAFETEYRDRGRELYLVDDTHMNRDGVELAARPS